MKKKAQWRRSTDLCASDAMQYMCVDVGVDVDAML
jgi:hypothetical protein